MAVLFVPLPGWLSLNVDSFYSNDRYNGYPKHSMRMHRYLSECDIRKFNSFDLGTRYVHKSMGVRVIQELTLHDYTASLRLSQQKVLAGTNWMNRCDALSRLPVLMMTSLYQRKSQ
jgi:hypothetical protein